MLASEMYHRLAYQAEIGRIRAGSVVWAPSPPARAVELGLMS